MTKGKPDFGAYTELVDAVNMFLEYDSYKRFLRVLRAEMAALRNLDREPLDWGCGYRILEEKRQHAEMVWEHPITEEKLGDA